MKKSLLLMILGSASYAMAQNTSDQIDPKTVNSKMTVEQTQAVEPASPNSTFTPSQEGSSSLGKFRPDVYDFVQIGITYYDLQTNASIGRRAILHDDGTVTMAWTYSGSQSTVWDDRGTGINYYDGTSWGSFPTKRTESSRTGWPSIGVLANGNVYTWAHDFNDGGFIMTQNTGKGKTDWTSAPEKLSGTTIDPIWARAANNGDILHVIDNMSGQDDNFPDVIIGGIKNPTTYSRSLDGGKTWVDQHILLPGYDSTRYLAGGGDTYAIDVRDSVVAIVIGGTTKDLALWKSMDNGDTWEKIMIDSFPYGAFEWGSKLIPQADNQTMNDGSIDVLIDNNNDVHVAFGMLGVYDEDTTDEFMSIPQFYNLFHWSENTDTIVSCGTPIDMDGSGTSGGTLYDISEETTNSMGSDGNPSGGLSYAARYGSTSISTHPSLSVDANNTIYVTYDCPVELFYHDYGANFRDVHISYSEDDGETWAVTQNATQERYKECVFACLTKRTDDFVRFVFQMDVHPGTNLQNNGNSGLHPDVENQIMYAAIPVQDIKERNLGQHTLSANPVEKDAKVFVVSQNYPNPFSGATSVIIYLRNTSDLTCTVTDASGKVVKEISYGQMNAGNHQLEIDGSDLSNGIYFYTLKSSTNQVTKSMNVVH
ncbi:MAG: T9SS type A sorting domain-containing protein [Bacteroidetes bacterium]|nr:T9SS type A sorting domain-containing protein [Bacteroidota bacterium]